MRILVSLILAVAVMAALVVGVVMAGAALAQSAGSKYRLPWLPETVPIALENPAWSMVNITRV